MFRGWVPWDANLVVRIGCASHDGITDALRALVTFIGSGSDQDRIRIDVKCDVMWRLRDKESVGQGRRYKPQNQG